MPCKKERAKTSAAWKDKEGDRGVTSLGVHPAASPELFRAGSCKDQSRVACRSHVFFAPRRGVERHSYEAAAAGRSAEEGPLGKSLVTEALREARPSPVADA